jgi:hypothetical protein
MAVSKYYVNISYVPKFMNGQTKVSIGGVTQSVPTYSSEYYIASMPEVKIHATGSSYTDALNNLLTIASSTNDPGNGPLSLIRNF